MSRAVATIPNSAPFSEEDVELLNRVVGPATAVQRAWLAGFLAGVEQAAGAPRPATGAAAEPLTIVFASESGNSEKLAGDMARQSRKLGFKPILIDMAELDLAALTAAPRSDASFATGRPAAGPRRGFRRTGPGAWPSRGRFLRLRAAQQAFGGGVHRVPDPVAEQVERQGGDQQRRARGTPMYHQATV